MKNILIMALALLAVPFTSGAQAQLTTRKVKIEDFSEKVTKIVLSGNIFYDSTLKEAVKAGWTISPYEFCTMDEFESLKTDADYYFLIKVKGQFRKESAPGIEFLSLLKGGPEAGDGIGKMLDLITFPYAASESPNGRETVFLPLILEVIQQHVLASVSTDFVAYASLGAYSANLGKVKDCKVLFAEDDLSSEISDEVKAMYFGPSMAVVDTDEADSCAASHAEHTVVSYTVCPDEPRPGSFCYKMLFNVSDCGLYYFRKHRITRKTGPGFLFEDVKRISEASN